MHFVQTVLSLPQGKMCVTNYATAHFTHCQSFYIPILFPTFQQILLHRPVHLGLHVKFSSMVYLLTTYEHTLFDALYFHTPLILQFYDVIFWSKSRDLAICNTVVIRFFSLPKWKLFRIIRCLKQNLKNFACLFLPSVNWLHVLPSVNRLHVLPSVNIYTFYHP